MTHVFEGAPDARQSADRIPVSRFRPRYRALSAEEKALHDDIKAKAAEMEALFERAADLHFADARVLPQATPDDMAAPQIGQMDPAAVYFADGMRALELSVMWTVKGLTS